MDIAQVGVPALLISVVEASFNYVQKVARYLPNNIVSAILFRGKLGEEHLTKYAFTQIVERYKDSIASFNRAVTLNIGFAALALYVFFQLPPDQTVKLPFLELDIDRAIWVSIAPVVCFGLQFLTFATFCWLMLLRLGIKLIIEEKRGDEDFGDITDVSLQGLIGYLWLAMRVGKFLNSKINYIWYVPGFFVLLGVLLSPMVICLFFIVQLWKAGWLTLGVIYAVCFVPYSLLFLLFLGTTVILIFGEFSKQLSKPIHPAILQLSGISDQSAPKA